MGIENLSIDTSAVAKILADKARLLEECKVKGHVPSGGVVVSSHGEIRTYDTCQRCNFLYGRTPTPKELKEYQRLLQTDFV